MWWSPLMMVRSEPAEKEYLQCLEAKKSHKAYVLEFLRLNRKG